jgi:hypothetical protein
MHLVAYALAMDRDPDELFCQGCTSYVHPFLDACPVCGTRRDALYAAATAEPDQGLAALTSHQRVTRDVSEVVLRYTLKLNSASPTANLREGLVSVADALPYRIRVGGEPAARTDRGRMEIGEADLIVREQSPAREHARIPLAAILSISPGVKDRRADAWAGLAFGELRGSTSLPPLDGDLVLAHAAPTGTARISFANPKGLLAPRARPDHYAIMGRWIGIVAAGEAEKRWLAVGPARNAQELGLTADQPDDRPVAAGETTPAAQPTVLVAMRQLEELRTAGFVSDDEYAAKRQEILDRI